MVVTIDSWDKLLCTLSKTLSRHNVQRCQSWLLASVLFFLLHLPLQKWADSCSSSFGCKGSVVLGVQGIHFSQICLIWLCL